MTFGFYHRLRNLNRDLRGNDRCSHGCRAPRNFADDTYTCILSRHSLCTAKNIRIARGCLLVYANRSPYHKSARRREKCPETSFRYGRASTFPSDITMRGGSR